MVLWFVKRKARRLKPIRAHQSACPSPPPLHKNICPDWVTHLLPGMPGLPGKPTSPVGPRAPV